MPIIRFVRENKDLKCQSGENLREIVLREGLELYGFKGKLGNCGGYGQCATCLISVESENLGALSSITDIEKAKLSNRPSNWRLACQCVVNSSLVVLTKPQSPPSDSKTKIKTAIMRKLPN